MFVIAAMRYCWWT